MTDTPVLRVSDLAVEYKRGVGRKPLRAVDGVSFELRPGQTFGLVGESGSGKTTIGNAVLGLVRVHGGSVDVAGAPVRRIGRASLVRASGDVQVIFQNPQSALDPQQPVVKSVVEPLLARRRRAAGTASDRAGLLRQAEAALDDVGLPRRSLYRYPREFSGGQLQRIAVARALIGRPRLIVCDEPVSSLDVSIRGQILNLLVEQQQRLGIAYLLISHDISVVRVMCQTTAVLYHGRIVESGPTQGICDAPTQDYTKALMNAVPKLRTDMKTERLSR